VDFHKKFNILTGLNGEGKTNLIDSIYYSCLGRSYFTTSDHLVTKSGEDFFRIESDIELDATSQKIIFKIVPSKTKEIEVAGVKLNKLSEHIGKFPCVMIAPKDMEIMIAGSEERRSFIDNTLSQNDKSYLQHLLEYNRLLKHRNACLKIFLENKRSDDLLLDTLSQSMKSHSDFIVKARHEFISKVSDSFDEIYRMVSGEKETVKLVYKTNLLDKDFLSLCAETLQKDKVLGRTTIGPHKDDIEFIMNSLKLKSFASQGQLKSFVVSLKLAQYHFLKSNTALLPILLLDDLFDKLDDLRVNHLFNILKGEEYGQIFITDTHTNTLHTLMQTTGLDHKHFYIQAAIVNPLHKDGIL
jgi:DNA replication and repair protein RecF